LKDFAYVAASSLGEAVGVLSTHGERAKVLAGGTDLLVHLRETPLEADVVLDVKRIPELGELRFDGGRGLVLGAAVPCWRLYDAPDIVNAYPALTDAARIVGGWQIQSRATVGGNLCNASPAADTVPPLIVERAVARIAGPSGERRVPVVEFCTAPRKTVLARGEMLIALEFPPPVERSGSRYLRFIPRNEMDIAVVGAAAHLTLDPASRSIAEARIALAAVAPTPVFASEASAWLAGKPATEESFVRAGELAKKAAVPISDLRGPAEYRLHLVGVLVRRALAGALDRARGGSREPRPFHPRPEGRGSSRAGRPGGGR
jgi:carbon-monoxide dehydrogenase medium subunit